MKKAFLFFALILLFSCTKFGKNVTVKGYVLNPITGQGIEGVTLKLLRTKLDLPGGFKEVKSTITDANGCFEISKFGLNDYYLQAQTGDRYNIGWFQKGELAEMLSRKLIVKKRKTMHADYHALEYGEIKIPIHNVNCQGPNDTLIFERNYISFPGINVFQPFTLTGCFNNDGSYAKVPSGDYLIEWTVIRNGISQNFSHILTVPGNGQTEFILNY